MQSNELVNAQSNEQQYDKTTLANLINNKNSQVLLNSKIIPPDNKKATIFDNSENVSVGERSKASIMYYFN